MSNRVGKLLVAHPNLPDDDWFRKTVIYIYSENEQGTLGVALNVETTTTTKKLCYDKGILYPSEHPRIYKGGPVVEQNILMLHSDEWSSRNTTHAGPRYRLSSDTVMLERLSMGDQPAYWRLLLGLCAWAPGQLDLELSGQFPYTAENSWLICDANDDIMFNYSGEEQWKAAVELCSHQMINQFF
jgi:putative transcriptional regulator